MSNIKRRLPEITITTQLDKIATTVSTITKYNSKLTTPKWLSAQTVT
jgi:hypothetical protein